MRRPIIYAQEQGRSYDFLMLARQTMYALGRGVSDLLGSTATVVAGLAATATGPASLTVNFAAGSVYAQAQVDATAYGTLAQDTTIVEQQGFYAAGTLVFSTAGLSAGQSRWALVQAIFTQTDVIPGDDPNSGILPYWNVNNPANPLVGPGNTGASQSTRRDGVCTLSIKYGAVATTGSEVPPSADANNVGLYLVDLVFGQTQITSGQILVAGPSVGTNVPGNYPVAPFLAGFLNSHHSGGAGQAPKIKLATEVQGILSLANMLASSALSGGGISTMYTYAGNPNTHVAGVQGVAGVSPPDLCEDTTTGAIWVCTATGNAGAAVWSRVNNPQQLWRQTFTSSGTLTFAADVTPSTVFRIRGCGAGGGAGGGAAGGNGNGGGGGEAGASADVLVKGFTGGQAAAITVGAHGNGANGSSDGANGGDTTFVYAANTLLSLQGGRGGTHGSASTVGPGGTGAAATVSGTGLTIIDQFSQAGAPGEAGTYLGNSIAVGGAGGDGPFGSGGARSMAGINGNVATGANGNGNGSGGGGGSFSGGTATTGGNGTDGVLIVERLTF